MSEHKQIIRIGTRESQLARLQTDVVVGLLSKKYPHLQYEIIPVKTEGDKTLNKPIAEIGTRGVFVKELEDELLANKVDIVVHSLKDLPTDLPEQLILASVLDRQDSRDVLISPNKTPLSKLKAGSRIATSSRRRTAQLRSIRQDLVFVDIRGNIPTRLRKFKQGDCDAMVLAAAGLIRLGLIDDITEYFDINTCTPAVGQGTLAIECRANDQTVLNLVSAITDTKIQAEITAERAFLDCLGGGCSVPIGAFAKIEDNGQLQLTGCIASMDGSKVFRQTLKDTATNATELGINLASKMLTPEAQEILESLKQTTVPIVSPP